MPSVEIVKPERSVTRSSGGMRSFTPGDEVSRSEKFGIGQEGERRRRSRVEGKQ